MIEPLPPRESHARSWALLAGAAALALIPSLLPAERPVERRRPDARAGWFLVLRMPAVTSQYESGEETMRRRYGEWLSALRKSGFTPVLLSEAAAARRAGRGLPERTVVTVFEPGYKRTYDIVGPILRAYRWPAVWLTDPERMRAGRRELLTFHDTRNMSRSGWWEIGSARRGGGYDLEGARSPDEPLTWAALDGTFALNRGRSLAGLNALNVQSDWLPDDLVRRLLAEVPAEGPRRLVKSEIQRREWGLALPPRRDGAGDFGLQARADRREARLHWLGTRGAPDFRLRLSARSMVGRLRLHLRSDQAAGSRLDVVLSPEDLRAEEVSGGRRRTLFSAALAREERVDAEVVLTGGTLRLSTRGRSWEARGLGAAPPDGLVEVSVFERMRGAARADGLSLEFTPL